MWNTLSVSFTNFAPKLNNANFQFKALIWRSCAKKNVKIWVY